MKKLSQSVFTLVIAIVIILPAVTNADDGYHLWLNYTQIKDTHLLDHYRQLISSIMVTGQTTTDSIIEAELKEGLSRLLAREIVANNSGIQDGTLLVGTPDNAGIIKKMNLGAELDTLGRDGFVVKSLKLAGKKVLLLAANHEIGLLYGSFYLLRQLQTATTSTSLEIVAKPKINLRLLNHWDRLEGSIERGYAGNSLWKWHELPQITDSRYRDYARANASIGINGTVLNNVNADPKILTEDYLIKVAKLADIFRPYGIKVYLSIFFSAPVSVPADKQDSTTRCTTADPLSDTVRQWWKTKAAEIYRYIPDFGGFLVKANSEGMPGPQDYGRSHADGANMLADALAPHHGIVMWRAFVYDADVDPDRAKRSYLEFVPLDGKFNANVFVQAKNGPIDFQPREPIQPLFGAMPDTPLMLELQITQEYLGHATHLVYLAPMWQEYLRCDTYARGAGSSLAKIIDGSLHGYPITGIAGVANTGDTRNWTGHLFGQANWYAFGRLAWDPQLTADQIAQEWIRVTFGADETTVAEIKKMMMGSWEACVNYMTPLGLHHIMQEGFHYGPQPSHNRGRPDWTSVYYHRADSSGLGFNRSSTGSNAVAQYFPPLSTMFNNPETCPEKYLLWFHHVDWQKKLRSGRTLWEELCFRYYSGTAYVAEMIAAWDQLNGRIDEEQYLHVKNKLLIQIQDAIIWRDTCVTYFQKFSQQEVPPFP